VKDELVQAVRDLGPASTPYTVADAVRAWLAKRTKNNGAGSVDGHPRLTNQHLIPKIRGHAQETERERRGQTGWTS
jgi:hypothetical protein